MLVLTRRSGESIVIGTEVVVTVLEVRGDQVRLGIDAPRSVDVYREEIFQQVVRENANAIVKDPKRDAAVRALLQKKAPKRPPPRKD